jgi:signal transduction histidine kinase
MTSLAAPRILPAPSATERIDSAASSQERSALPFDQDALFARFDGDVNALREIAVIFSNETPTILRCVQEVVTNAARHSGAENLWITVKRSGDTFEVRARDDGRGRGAAGDGFGLRGMRERIESAGGALTIESGTGRGFALTAFLPARSAS